MKQKSIEKYLEEGFGDKPSVGKTICNHVLYLQKEQFKEKLQLKIKEIKEKQGKDEYSYCESSACSNILNQLIKEIS